MHIEYRHSISCVYICIVYMYKIFICVYIHRHTHKHACQEYTQESLNNPILWMQSDPLRHKMPVYLFILIKYSHEIKHGAINPITREFHPAFVISVVLEAFF